MSNEKLNLLCFQNQQLLPLRIMSLLFNLYLSQPYGTHSNLTCILLTLDLFKSQLKSTLFLAAYGSMK